MHKSNKKEIENRILEISKMLLRGLSNSEICRYASLNWGISDRQTQRYIKRCYDLWHKEFEKRKKRNLSYHLAKRRDLYKQAYDKKQWNICLEIIKDEAKIMGTYPADKLELTEKKIIVLGKQEKSDENDDKQCKKS